MTRTISTWPSAEVSCDTSDSDAGSSDGCVIFHAAPSFFSVVASPADRRDLHLLDLVRLQRREDLLLLLGVVSALLPPAGIFEVTK